jgi:hypothetical protein
MRELKNRKKFEPTSTAVPAASAASIALTEVMPLLPSGVGQSLTSMMRTGPGDQRAHERSLASI